MFQRSGKTAYKCDLDNAHLIDYHFNYPHRYYDTIHVAGTNGKGSVAHMTASILMAAGYKTGLFTSPHLVDFRERIKVNGRKISKQYVNTFTRKANKHIENIKPSFFELTTFMALNYFKDKNVDIAVIETGLGGRLDTTNVLSPILSVITNIGMDHTDILGDSLQKIAAEKAGIIKHRIPLVIGETQESTKDIFIKGAKNKSAPIYFADQEYKVKEAFYKNFRSQVISLQNHEPGIFETDLFGKYQEKNLITTIKAIDCLKQSGYQINSDEIKKGLKNVIKNTSLRGRMEIVRKKPLTICDIAHNPEGINELMNNIRFIKYKELHIIIGSTTGKQVDEIFSLMPGNAHYYFTKSSVSRSMDIDQITSAAKKQGLNGSQYQNVKKAYNDALSHAGPDDLILICGSTFIVADFLSD